jgi:hypothetical protein
MFHKLGDDQNDLLELEALLAKINSKYIPSRTFQLIPTINAGQKHYVVLILFLFKICEYYSKRSIRVDIVLI